MLGENILYKKIYISFHFQKRVGSILCKDEFKKKIYIFL